MNPKRKPNKLYVDQWRTFYKSSMPKWLADNDILMYSTQNKRLFDSCWEVYKTLMGKSYKIIDRKW